MGPKTALALRYFELQQGDSMSAELNEVATALSAFATQTARRVHFSQGSVHQPAAGEFIEAAASEILMRIGKFIAQYERPGQDRSGDPFVSWTWTVLKRQYFTLGRKQKRFRQAMELMCNSLREPQAEDCRLEPVGLTPQVLAALAELEAIDRVLVVCMGQAWKHLEIAKWIAWRRAAGLEGEFPPNEFVNAPRGKRRAILGDAMGLSIDTVYQRMHRVKINHPELEQLLRQQ